MADKSQAVEYRIVSASTSALLSDVINRMARVGWRTEGHIIVTQKDVGLFEFAVFMFRWE